MTTLHLGIIDIPYAGPSYFKAPKGKALGRAKRGKAAAIAAAATVITTAQVATILEAKYHIMETFFELNEDHIADQCASSVKDAIDALLMGAPPALDIFGDATAAITADFKMFLSNKGMDATSTPGVPTAAALAGVSHRFLHPYAKRGSRPSFIDTGLYQANMISWID